MALCQLRVLLFDTSSGVIWGKQSLFSNGGHVLFVWRSDEGWVRNVEGKIYIGRLQMWSFRGLGLTWLGGSLGYLGCGGREFCVHEKVQLGDSKMYHHGV